MRKFTLSILAALACFSVVADDFVYRKFKAADLQNNDWSGVYLIVNEVEDASGVTTATVMNGALEGDALDAKNSAIKNVSVSTGTDGVKYIASTPEMDAAVFTVAKSTMIEEALGDWYSIKSESGYFIGHKDTADNGMSVEPDLKKKCNIALSFVEGKSKVNALAYSESGENSFVLCYNKKADQERFRFFADDNRKEDIWFYKRVPADPATLEALKSESHAEVRKVIVNGQLYLVAGGKYYDVLGREK